MYVVECGVALEENEVFLGLQVLPVFHEQVHESVLLLLHGNGHFLWERRGKVVLILDSSGLECDEKVLVEQSHSEGRGAPVRSRRTSGF